MEILTTQSKKIRMFPHCRWMESIGENGENSIILLWLIVTSQKSTSTSTPNKPLCRSIHLYSRIDRSGLSGTYVYYIRTVQARIFERSYFGKISSNLDILYRFQHAFFNTFRINPTKSFGFFTVFKSPNLFQILTKINIFQY